MSNWIKAWRIVNDIDYAMQKIRKKLDKHFSVKLVKRHDQLQLTKERIKHKYFL